MLRTMEPLSQDMENYYEVGRVKDAHGLKGELYIRLFSEKAEWLQQLESFQLRRSPGNEVADFKVKKARPHRQGLILWPEGFENRNQSEEWKGAQFWIPLAYVTTPDDEEPYLREILGFQVFDTQLGRVGVVTGFMENGAQILLVVESEGREILIPYVDPFIRDLKRLEKELHMELPEGLVE